MDLLEIPVNERGGDPGRQIELNNAVVLAAVNLIEEIALIRRNIVGETEIRNQRFWRASLIVPAAQRVPVMRCYGVEVIACSA